MFQPLTVPSTFVAGLVAVDVVSTAIAVVSYTCLHRASSASDAMDHTYLPSVRELESIETALGDARATARGLFMHCVAANIEAADAAKRELEDQLSRVRSHIDAYEALDSRGDERACWSEFTAAWGEWHPLVERYVARLDASDLTEAYNVVFGPAQRAVTTMEDSLEHCIMLNMSYSHAASRRAESGQRFADFSVGIASVASLVLAIGIAVIARTGTNPIEAVVRTITGFLP